MLLNLGTKAQFNQLYHVMQVINTANESVKHYVFIISTNYWFWQSLGKYLKPGRLWLCNVTVFFPLVFIIIYSCDAKFPNVFVGQIFGLKYLLEVYLRLNVSEVKISINYPHIWMFTALWYWFKKKYYNTIFFRCSGIFLILFICHFCVLT